MGIALVAVAVLAGTGIYALAGRLSLNMEKMGTKPGFRGRNRRPQRPQPGKNGLR